MAIAGIGFTAISSQNRNAMPIITTTTFPSTAPKPHLLHNSKNGFHLQSKLPTNTACSCVANTTAPDFAAQIPNPTTTSWSDFAKRVSGEWDGFGADFTIQRNPIELPESVVLEAYKEWEVKVFDWHTQCPTLTQPDRIAMAYKTIKLLPTVGCEADAATRYSIDERVVGGLDNKVAAFAYHCSGSYVALWLNGEQLELEHCLINPQDGKSRVRVIQVVGVDNANTKMGLENIRVFCEQWYGPFRNGDQLGGCAIGDSAFISTAALKSSQVAGIWQRPSSVTSFDASQSDFLKELSDGRMQKTVRDECDLILLPRQLWCSLKDSTDGETCCEVGWVFDQGRAVTSRCIFSGDAKLKEISPAHETTTLESG